MIGYYIVEAIMLHNVEAIMKEPKAFFRRTLDLMTELSEWYLLNAWKNDW